MTHIRSTMMKAACAGAAAVAVGLYDMPPAVTMTDGLNLKAGMSPSCTEYRVSKKKIARNGLVTELSISTPTHVHHYRTLHPMNDRLRKKIGKKEEEGTPYEEMKERKHDGKLRDDGRLYEVPQVGFYYSAGRKDLLPLREKRSTGATEMPSVASTEVSFVIKEGSRIICLDETNFQNFRRLVDNITNGRALKFGKERIFQKNFPRVTQILPAKICVRTNLEDNT